MACHQLHLCQTARARHEGLEKHRELSLEDGVRDLLLHISPATVDRLLYAERDKRGHGLGTTKPGTLLTQSIPIRAFADWDEQCPGFFEAKISLHFVEKAKWH